MFIDNISKNSLNIFNENNKVNKEKRINTFMIFCFIISIENNFIYIRS